MAKPNKLGLQNECNIETFKNLLHAHKHGYIQLTDNLYYEVKKALERSEELV